MKNFIGVVADDTTGANDIAIMFKRGNTPQKYTFMRKNKTIKWTLTLLLSIQTVDWIHLQ